MKRFVTTFLAVAGLLGGVALATAQPEAKERGGRWREARFERLSTLLDLTPEQRERVKALSEEHRKQMEPLRSEGRDLHNKLRETMKQENPDPTTVGTAMLALKQHRESLKTSRTAFFEQLKTQLTPEQRQKLESWEASRGAGRRHHRKGGHGRFEHPDGGPAIKG